jgi:hypothetical protein
MPPDTPKGSRHDESQDDDNSLANRLAVRSSSKRRRADTTGNVTQDTSRDSGSALSREERPSIPQYKVECVKCILQYTRANGDAAEKTSEASISSLTADGTQYPDQSWQSIEANYS